MDKYQNIIKTVRLRIFSQYSQLICPQALKCLSSNNSGLYVRTANETKEFHKQIRH